MSHRFSRLAPALGATVSLALIASLAILPDAAAAEPVNRPAAPALQIRTATTQQLLDAAAVVKPVTTGYSPYKFITVAQRNKKDRLGCNLNRQLLIKAATIKPKVAKGCKISGGLWMASGGTVRVTDWRKVALAPMMSFKQAWGLGAYAWTPAQRYAWATNVIAPPRTRAAGVTPLQATNQILLASDLKDLLNKGITPSTLEFLLAGTRSGPTVFAFILSLAATMGDATYVLQEWTKFLNNDKICDAAIPATAAILTNTSGWGLGISEGTWLTLDDTIDTCRSQQSDSYRYAAYYALQGIPPIKSSIVVPNPGKGSGSAGGVRLYSDYGTPATAAVTPSLFGLHAPPDTGSVPQVNYGYLRLWDSAVSWADLNPSKGVYNWTKLKEALASPIARNREVMYVLGNTPAWAGDGSPNSAPTNMNDVYDFVKALCGQAEGRITTYEAWNEGNLQTFWKGTQEQLAQVTKQVRRALTDCPSGGNVVAASTGTRAEGAFVTNYNAYLQELAKLGWPIDGYAVHSYPSATGGPAERLDGVTQFKTMLAVNGAPVKPIYDSEVNFGLAGLGQNHIDLDVPTSGAYISRTFIDSVRYGIDHVFWFLWTPAYYNKLGIQMNPATPFQNLAWNQTFSWLVGSRMQRCSDATGFSSDITATLTMCQLTTASGGNMTLAWTNGPTVKVDTTGLGNDWAGINGDAGRIAGNSLEIGPSPIAIR